MGKEGRKVCRQKVIWKKEKSRKIEYMVGEIAKK